MGDAGVGVGFLLFLIIGNVGAGAASAPEFLPRFWRVLGPWFPPGATATALRNTAYFDGAQLGQPILTLVGWAVLGVVASGLAVRIPERVESDDGDDDAAADAGVRPRPIGPDTGPRGPTLERRWLGSALPHLWWESYSSWPRRTCPPPASSASSAP